MLILFNVLRIHFEIVKNYFINNMQINIVNKLTFLAVFNKMFIKI
jgi:hypothetical protein